MPERYDNRQFRRALLQLPLQHKLSVAGTAGVGVGWTRDVSEGGACVELPEVLQPPLPLQIRLHTARGPIEAEAQVVWGAEAQAVREAEAQVVWAWEAGSTGRGVLHGLAFTQLSPSQRYALRTVLQRNAEESPASVRLPLRVPATCEPENPGGPPLLGETEAISRETLSLRLPWPLPPGTLVRLILHTPHEPLMVKGTVVQVEPPEQQRPGEAIRLTVRLTPLGWYASLYLGLILMALS
jgi:hypothetical protein